MAGHEIARERPPAADCGCCADGLGLVLRSQQFRGVGGLGRHVPEDLGWTDGLLRGRPAFFPPLDRRRSALHSLDVRDPGDTPRAVGRERAPRNYLELSMTRKPKGAGIFQPLFIRKQWNGTLFGPFSELSRHNRRIPLLLPQQQKRRNPHPYRHQHPAKMMAEQISGQLNELRPELDR